MHLLFDITHPAHVHLFRNAIDELSAQDHELLVTSREKEITTQLLDAYGIDHQPLSNADGASLAREWLGRTWRLVSVAHSFEPDVIVSRFNPAAAQVSKLLRCPYVMFDDTKKDSSLVCRLTYGGADIICTPDSFGPDLGPNHVRYSGLHELAYLHPERFSPNKKRLEEYGVDADETYFVVRFVGWDAHHDTGESGFSPEERSRLVSLLSEQGKVYITSEAELSPALSQYQLPIPPEDIHHLLSYANLFVGDSQTMTCEAGVLGTPAVRYNSLADDESDHAPYLDELEEEYSLVYSTSESRQAFDHIETIGYNELGSERWRKQQERLLADKIDVTAYMLETIADVGSAGPRRLAVE